MTRFVLVGAGGIGTALATLLGAAGHRVRLVTRSEADATEINASGTSVFGAVDATASLLASAGPVQVDRDDVLMLAVKAHQTDDALARVDGAPGAVLSLQNGIEKDEPLIERFGAGSVLLSVIQVTATLVSPGRSRCASIAPSAISALEPSGQGLANAVESALTASGVDTQLVADARAIEWSKAAQWIPSSLLTAASGVSLDAALCDPETAVACVRIARECAAVASRRGIELVPFPGLYACEIVDGPFADAVATLVAIGERMRGSGLAGYRTAMELDLARGDVPELEPTAGVMLDAADAVEVACPALATAHAIVRARADHRRPNDGPSQVEPVRCA